MVAGGEDVVVGGEVVLHLGAGAGGGGVAEAGAVDAEAICPGGVEGEGGGDGGFPDGLAERVVVLCDEGLDEGELPPGAGGGCAAL